MFTRTLIRLRWPLAVAAALSLVLMLLTVRFSLGWVLPLGSLGREITVRAFRGQLQVTWRNRSANTQVWFSRVPEDTLWYWNWWKLGTWTTPIVGTRNFDIPLLLVAAPCALLAFVGFRARRRQPTGDQCAKCGYPLKGAHTCAECGRAAPSN